MSILVYTSVYDKRNLPDSWKTFEELSGKSTHVQIFGGKHKNTFFRLILTKCQRVGNDCEAGWQGLQVFGISFQSVFPFRDVLLWGFQTPEYMAPIGLPIETQDQLTLSAIIVVVGGGVEKPHRGPCLTGLPIKIYGPALHVYGRGGKLHPTFLW